MAATGYNLIADWPGGDPDHVTETAHGTWKPPVQDAAAQDTGYVNGWKLTF